MTCSTSGRWIDYIHSITIFTGDLVHNTLFLLRYSQFYPHSFLLQGVSCGEDIVNVEGSTYSFKSLTESMDVRGVQGPLWFGELQIGVWLFWGGGQCLFHQVSGETICLENLIEVL